MHRLALCTYSGRLQRDGRQAGGIQLARVLLYQAQVICFLSASYKAIATREISFSSARHPHPALCNLVEVERFGQYTPHGVDGQHSSAWRTVCACILAPVQALAAISAMEPSNCISSGLKGSGLCAFLWRAAPHGTDELALHSSGMPASASERSKILAFVRRPSWRMSLLW